MSQQGHKVGLGSITKGALYLLIATAGLSLFFQMSGDEMKMEIGRFVAASGHSVWSEFKIWTLATSPFLELEFVGLIFQGFMLAMFVPALERWWGTKRFLKFVAYTSLTGTVMGTLAALLIPSVPDGTPIAGMEPFIYSSIVAFGVLFANQPVQFFGVLPMTGRQLTIGICAFMAVFIVIGQQWAEGVAYASAMFVAWLLTSGKWTPKIWLLKRKQKKMRAKLRLVRDDETPEKYLN